MEQVFLLLNVINMQKDINGVHIVKGEFCPFLEGGWQLEASFLFSHFFFNFENLSAHLVANILNFPKQPLCALF